MCTENDTFRLFVGSFVHHTAHHRPSGHGIIKLNRKHYLCVNCDMLTAATVECRMLNALCRRHRHHLRFHMCNSGTHFGRRILILFSSSAFCNCFGPSLSLSLPLLEPEFRLGILGCRFVNKNIVWRHIFVCYISHMCRCQQVVKYG